MTVDTSVGTFLLLLGVRRDSEALCRELIEPGSLILGDLSYLARLVAPPREATWLDVFKALEYRLWPLIQQNTPSTVSEPLPIVLAMDSRPHYTKDRDYVQTKRYKDADKYPELPSADNINATIDFPKLFNTSGGHHLFVSAYASWTALPLIIIQHRDEPVLFCNTTAYPKFLRHKVFKLQRPLVFEAWSKKDVFFTSPGKEGARSSLDVLSFFASRASPAEPASEDPTLQSGKVRCYKKGVSQLQVCFPMYGNPPSHETLAECDNLLPFLYYLEMQADPGKQEKNMAYIVCCDGDSFMSGLINSCVSPSPLPAKPALTPRILWPTAGDPARFTVFDMDRLLRVIQPEMRMSVAVWVYLAGGSDFGPPLPLFGSPAAMISIVFGLVLGCFPAPSEEDGLRLRTACQEIYTNMIFVDPCTLALDKIQLRKLLGLVAALPQVYYINRTNAQEKQAAQDLQDGRRELSCMHVLCYDKSCNHVRLGTRKTVPAISPRISKSTLKKDNSKSALEEGFVFGPNNEWDLDRAVDAAYQFACYLRVAHLVVD